MKVNIKKGNIGMEKASYIFLIIIYSRVKLKMEYNIMEKDMIEMVK